MHVIGFVSENPVRQDLRFQSSPGLGVQERHLRPSTILSLPLPQQPHKYRRNGPSSCEVLSVLQEQGTSVQ